VYLQDVDDTLKHLLLVSPFVTQKRMAQREGLFKELLKKQVKITIITRPAESYGEDRRAGLKNLFSKADGVQMVFKPKIHQKFAVIDNKLT